MARYNNLPVYKLTYDLLLEVFKIVKLFPREYKYNLWDKIKNEIIDLIWNIYKANSSFDDRLSKIKSSREQVETLRLYFRLSKDLLILNLNKFVSISEKIESLSKQLYSWEKSFSKKTKPDGNL